MKRALFVFILFCSVVLAGQASAVMLSLLPPSQSILPGDIATVDLEISGLGDFQPDSLGAFFLDITYDDTVLAFDSVSFGGYLGDPSLFEADAYSDDSTSGIVHLDEVSWLFDWELDALQPDTFTLATLSFANIGGGYSHLLMENVVLSDAIGEVLRDPELNNAGVGVIPEPTTMLLLGSGLTGLAALRRKFKG